MSYRAKATSLNVVFSPVILLTVMFILATPLNEMFAIGHVAKCDIQWRLF